ncbi:MAG: cytochrome c [Gammaproteobacteria bacterium]|nr:cytochrome c [Gammaproteobacteria bacterium]
MFVCGTSAVTAEITEARQAELLNLLRQDCGSCHGMTLKGGLGPALTPDALATKSGEMLVQTIIGGRPGTPMPPWAPFLSQEEAWWLVNILKEGTGVVAQP